MSAAARSFHYTTCDGNQVQLRVFVPTEAPEGEPRPAVVMVCGLMWLGEGLLGHIGLTFNDSFGYSFAKCGVPCVQLHTPSRHIAYTRLPEVMQLLTWPLTYFYPARIAHIVGMAAFVAIKRQDFLPLLLILPLASRLGLAAAPLAHLLIRLLQWYRGAIPGPKRRDHQREIAAAVEWAKQRKDLLRSNDDIVLCGYSSGGHCASLFAGSKSAPKLKAVLLVSGLYGLRTHAWTGARKLLAPLFNLLFLDILGVGSNDERDIQSPDYMIQRDMDGQDWYVLSAQMELMNLHPFQDILFSTKALCDALTAKGAKVHRATCGLNHWLLVLQFNTFVKGFCSGLTMH
mmetsp:Transcript_89147/g.186285  ORF Transcript_89147/g.186285 Transcript_89147/m.186285 type:complete len:344 (+) Transcript_89147:79-1110(+)